MAARNGPTNPWSGPRLPRDTEPTPVPAKPKPENRPHHCATCDQWHYPRRPSLAADPALGRKVARCRTCGTSSDLLVFDLILRGKPVGVYRLCGACYYAANPIDPQAGDPLRAA